MLSKWLEVKSQNKIEITYLKGSVESKGKQIQDLINMTEKYRYFNKTKYQFFSWTIDFLHNDNGAKSDILIRSYALEETKIRQH